MKRTLAAGHDAVRRRSPAFHCPADMKKIDERAREKRR